MKSSSQRCGSCLLIVAKAMAGRKAAFCRLRLFALPLAQLASAFQKPKSHHKHSDLQPSAKGQLKKKSKRQLLAGSSAGWATGAKGRAGARGCGTAPGQGLRPHRAEMCAMLAVAQYLLLLPILRNQVALALLASSNARKSAQATLAERGGCRSRGKSWRRQPGGNGSGGSRSTMLGWHY